MVSRIRISRTDDMVEIQFSLSKFEFTHSFMNLSNQTSLHKPISIAAQLAHNI